MVLKLKGRTAVVTGAAGGIGRAIAVSLARRSCHLALADIDDSALAYTAAEIRGKHAKDNIRISRHHLDVSDRAAVSALPTKVTAEHDGVDVVVNNAGVALGGTFLEVAESDFDWLFGINFWSVVQMTRAFLPLLQKSEEARLVNISSLFGLIAPPGQTAYCASKFAVRGFSEALRHELAGTRIGITVVHPGGSPPRSRRTLASRAVCPRKSWRGDASSSTPFSPCRRKSPAKSSFVASKIESRAFWSVGMPSMRPSSNG